MTDGQTEKNVSLRCFYQRTKFTNLFRVSGGESAELLVFWPRKETKKLHLLFPKLAQDSKNFIPDFTKKNLDKLMKNPSFVALFWTIVRPGMICLIGSGVKSE